MMAMAASPTTTTTTTTTRTHLHPPYKEMIVSAIESLKDRKGSSKTAIAKYIVANYTHLPLKHDALLAHHLRRLKKKGVIRMIKHSYKLATSGGAPLILPQGMKPIIPKKRGRPPKILTGTEKRKPGRPRKVLAQEGIGPPTEKRKPGKPRKGSSVAELILPKSMKSMLNAERRKPGRPKKGSSPFKLKPAAAVAVGERRKPGRPKKGSSPIKLKPAAAKAVGEKKKPGRPKKGSSPIKLKSAAAVAVGEKRKPGRLKKVLSAVEDGDGNPRPQNTVGGALVVVKHGGGGTPSKPVFSSPKKTVGEVAVTPLSVATSGEKKKRGRPKKGLTPFTLAAVKDDDGMLPLTTTKRRGRPPKKSDTAAPEKMGSEKKRSVGRPKKNVEV